MTALRAFGAASALVGEVAVVQTPVDQVPHPVWNAKSCQNPNSYPDNGDALSERRLLCDVEGKISYGDRHRIEDAIEDLKRYTLDLNCKGRGHNMGFLVVQKMTPEGSEKPKETASRYAKALMEKWEVPEKGCQNGLFLIISKGDELAHLEVGASVDEKKFSQKDADALVASKIALSDIKSTGTMDSRIKYDLVPAMKTALKGDATTDEEFALWKAFQASPHGSYYSSKAVSQQTFATDLYSGSDAFKSFEEWKVYADFEKFLASDGKEFASQCSMWSPSDLGTRFASNQNIYVAFEEYRASSGLMFIIMMLLLVVLLVVGAYFAWQKWGDQIKASAAEKKAIVSSEA